MVFTCRTVIGAVLVLWFGIGASARAECTVPHVPLGQTVQVQKRVGYVDLIGDHTHTADGVRAIHLQAMAAQLEAAQWLFASVFGVDSPMAMPRYRQVDRVEALIVPMTMAGVAYDETVRTTPSTAPTVCVLRLKVANHLRPHNITPAHELFHLFQYGLTMFKRPWLIEGTARWAETAFVATAPVERPLPQNAHELRVLLRSSYGAGPIWNRLTRLLDPEGLLAPPDHIKTLTYHDGSPVLASRRLHGQAFMRDLFSALGEADRAIALREGLPPFRWKERDQKAPIHDAAIWQVVQQVAASHAAQGLSTTELNTFLSIALEPGN